MTKINRIISFSYFLFALGFGLIPIYGAATPKKVLIFSSEDANRPAMRIIEDAIRTTLSTDQSNQVAFYKEAQDNARIPNEKYEAEYVDYLRQKYADEKIDLVFVWASPGIRFLLKHEAEIFTGVPKI